MALAFLVVAVAAVVRAAGPRKLSRQPFLHRVRHNPVLEVDVEHSMPKLASSFLKAINAQGRNLAK